MRMGPKDAPVGTTTGGGSARTTTGRGRSSGSMGVAGVDGVAGSLGVGGVEGGGGAGNAGTAGTAGRSPGAVHNCLPHVVQYAASGYSLLGGYSRSPSFADMSA